MLVARMLYQRSVLEDRAAVATNTDLASMGFTPRATEPAVGSRADA